MLRDKTIGVLGAGNMGGALIRGALNAAVVRPGQIIASHLDEEALVRLHSELRIRTTTDNEALVRASDVVLLSVKPQQLPVVLGQVARAFTPEHTLISVAAGITTTSIEAALDADVPVIRAMPNTPSLVGEGACAYCLGAHAGADHALEAAELLSAVGIALQVEEAHMDAVTAVSGSGPAYIFYLLEGLYRGAEAVGLPAQAAQALVKQTVLGAARLVLASGEDPAELRRKVTSPGGTTAAALKVLEEADLHGTLGEAITAARNRGVELGRGD